jgi:thiamine-monophosphate kinase
LGEIALMERIHERLEASPSPEVWSGDDAALVEVSGARLLFTIDALIEGIDFDLSYSRGADVGFKAIAVSVSDVAAMGGRPSRAVAALVLRPDTRVEFVDELVTGMNESCSTWGLGLAGGDISGGAEISLSVAMIGALTGAPVLRSGARAGDAICVTGRLGGAAGGLAALRAGRGSSSAGVKALVRRHLRPEARLEEAVLLADLAPSAMIDVSDGLVVDLWRVMEASGTGCEIDEGGVPRDPGLDEVVDLIDPLEAALIGGDDYELLLAIDESRLDDAVSSLSGIDAELTRIGTVTDGARTIGGRPIDLWREKAWEHLRGR